MDQLPQADLLALQLAHSRVEAADANAQLAQAVLDNIMLKIYLKHSIPVNASISSSTGKITLAQPVKENPSLDIDQV